MYRKFFSAFLLAMLVLTFAIPASVSAAEKCYYEGSSNTGDESLNDCNGYPAAIFPGGQIDPSKCYIVSGLLPGARAQEAPSCSDPRFSGGGGSSGTFNTGNPTASADECGENGVKLSINIGCRAQSNPIVDMFFAFIRFLSAGVGLIVIGSIIVAGIQYIASQGDPNATAKALGRISSAFTALLIYIFAAALLNFLIPAGIFR